MDNTQVHIDSTKLDSIRANLPKRTASILLAIGFDVEAFYKSHENHIDTSAMVNSTYTVGRSKSGLVKARAEAKSSNPTVKVYPHPKPEVDHVHVGPSVGYALYIEEGTTRMSGDHMLRFSGMKVAQEWNTGNRWKDLIK